MYESHTWVSLTIGNGQHAPTGNRSLFSTIAPGQNSAKYRALKKSRPCRCRSPRPASPQGHRVALRAPWRRAGRGAVPEGAAPCRAGLGGDRRGAERFCEVLSDAAAAAPGPGGRRFMAGDATVQLGCLLFLPPAERPASTLAESTFNSWGQSTVSYQHTVERQHL